MKTQTTILALNHMRRVLNAMADDMNAEISTGQFSEDPVEFHKSRAVAFMDSGRAGIENALAELVLVREVEND